MTVLSRAAIQDAEIVRLSGLRDQLQASVAQSKTGLSGGMSRASYDLHVREGFVLWPGRFVLGSVLEEMELPANVCGVVHDKSSLARKGISLFNTFIEPGWKGFLTVEIVNHAWSFRRILAGQPIAQVVFHYLDSETDPYRGKYQDQPPRPIPALRG